MAPTEKLVTDTVSAGVGGGTTGLSEVGMSCCRTGETACCVKGCRLHARKRSLSRSLVGSIPSNQHVWRFNKIRACCCSPKFHLSPW